MSKQMKKDVQVAFLVLFAAGAIWFALTTTYVPHC